METSSRSRRDLLRLASGGALLGTGAASLAGALLQVQDEVFAENRSFLRRNVYDLKPDGSELRAYRRAISVMKQRPALEPTSWQYQANIHGTRDRRLLAGWNSCQHANWYFLSWHRMYLYWFERIVRKASGDRQFALPYWNYENPNQTALPPAFRRPSTRSNPLYVEERRREANAGKEPPASSASSQRALATERFISTNVKAGFGGERQDEGTGFVSGALESSPHNSMHVWIGGNGLMSDPDTAAQDPIFWLHHANIDRLWEVWLNQEGRSNPTEEDRWMNESFVFFDEDGRRIEMSSREVDDLSRKLDYEYDDVPAAGRAAAGGQEPATRAEDGSRNTFATANAIQLSDRRSTVSLSAARDARSITDAGSTVLELTDVTATGEGGFVYEVYVGLRAGATPDFRDPSFAGNLTSFGLPRLGASGHASHGGGTGKTFRFAIEADVSGSELAVTFVPVVTSEGGNRGVNARIGRIAING